MMPDNPSFEIFAMVFFTVLLAVFLAVAYSVVMGIVENYARYYQKADLQWTGPRKLNAGPNRVRNLAILVAVSFGLAWVIVRFLVMG